MVDMHTRGGTDVEFMRKRARNRKRPKVYDRTTTDGYTRNCCAQ